MRMRSLINGARRWLADEDGISAVEFALIVPVILTLIMGIYDIGRGFNVNQKVITASQVMGDLITRKVEVTQTDLDDIVIAGEMAIAPYPIAPLGYDIVSISFDSDGNAVEEWRRTVNMSANANVLDDAEIIATPGDGLVAVTVDYDYDPFFSKLLPQDIGMREISFYRGRKTPVVRCGDCP